MIGVYVNGQQFSCQHTCDKPTNAEQGMPENSATPVDHIDRLIHQMCISPLVSMSRRLRHHLLLSSFKDQSPLVTDRAWNFSRLKLPRQKSLFPPVSLPRRFRHPRSCSWWSLIVTCRFSNDDTGRPASDHSVNTKRWRYRDGEPSISRALAHSRLAYINPGTPRLKRHTSQAFSLTPN